MFVENSSVSVYTLFVNQSEAVFLNFSCRKLLQMASRIGTCLDSLTEAQIWARSNDTSNAVGHLVLHLAGNVRQWIISGVGGAPDTRQRDTEFDACPFGSAELSQLLTSTLTEAIGTLRALPEEKLMQTLEIQGFRLTALEAIYHAVEHFSGHTFQIILLAKAQRNRPFDFYGYLTGPHENETP